MWGCFFSSNAQEMVLPAGDLKCWRQNIFLKGGGEEEGDSDCTVWKSVGGK